MKRYLLVIFVCVLGGSLWAQDLQTSDQTFFNPDNKQVEIYQFRVDYRVEGGYAQHWQHTKNNESRLYLHGVRIGATFDFVLPHHLSLQTGVLYTLTHGRTQQKWGVVNEEESYAASDSIIHRITEHWLAVPIRLYYNIPLWKKLNMFFYGGPQLMIGLAETDNIDNQLPTLATQHYTQQGVHLTEYNRFEEELYPINFQLGIGGGFEWDCFRLQTGYDFGLNNQIKQHKINGQHLWEWSWYVSFAYKLPTK